MQRGGGGSKIRHALSRQAAVAVGQMDVSNLVRVGLDRAGDAVLVQRHVEHVGDDFHAWMDELGGNRGGLFETVQEVGLVAVDRLDVQFDVDRGGEIFRRAQ